MKIIYLTKIDGFIKNGVLDRFGISYINLCRRIAGIAHAGGVNQITTPQQIEDVDLILCDTSCDPESIMRLLKTPMNLAIVVHQGQTEFNNFFGRMSRKWPEQEIISRREHSDDGYTFDLVIALAEARDSAEYDLTFNNYLADFRQGALADFRRHMMNAQLLENCYFNHFSPDAQYKLPYLLRSLLREEPELKSMINQFSLSPKGSQERTILLQKTFQKLAPSPSYP